MAVSLPRRADVAREHTWNLESIYPTTAHWERAFEEVESSLPSLARFRGTLGSSGATLLEWFRASESLAQTAGKLYVYARLGFDTNTTDQDRGALVGRAQGLMARLGAATAFEEPELLALSPEE